MVRQKPFKRCFPEVVADFGQDLIPPAAIDACVANSSTEVCEAFLRTDGATVPGVIGECLRQHIACADAGTWVGTIDRCVSLALLEASARDEAQSCLSAKSCDAVEACLDQHGAISW